MQAKSSFCPLLWAALRVCSFHVFQGWGGKDLCGFLARRPSWLELPAGGESRSSHNPGSSFPVGAFDLDNCVKVYWPARVAGKLLLFRLQLWDAGDAAVRKYGHVYPVCRCKDSSSPTTID